MMYLTTIADNYESRKSPTCLLHPEWLKKWPKEVILEHISFRQPFYFLNVYTKWFLLTNLILMKADFWQVGIFPLKKVIAIPGRIHQTLGDGYYLKTRKWFNYWQKTKRETTIIFESPLKKDRNFVYSAKYNQHHNKALNNWYDSLWIQAVRSCLWSLPAHRWWHDLKSLLLLEKPVSNYNTLLRLPASSTCTAHEQLCSSQQCTWHWTRAQLSHHMGMLVCQHGPYPGPQVFNPWPAHMLQWRSAE